MGSASPFLGVERQYISFGLHIQELHSVRQCSPVHAGRVSKTLVAKRAATISFEPRFEVFLALGPQLHPLHGNRSLNSPQPPQQLADIFSRVFSVLLQILRPSHRFQKASFFGLSAGAFGLPRMPSRPACPVKKCSKPRFTSKWPFWRQRLVVIILAAANISSGLRLYFGFSALSLKQGQVPVAAQLSNEQSP